MDRKTRQRGVAAVFGAITMIAALAAIGVIVDLGRFYYYQRDLQRIASVAALDAARKAGGCLAPGADPQATAFNEVVAAVIRNGGDASWVESTRVGRMETANDLRFFDTQMSEDNRAVEVVMARPMPPRLIPIGSGTARLGASAAAYSRPRAQVAVGAKPLSVNDPFAAASNEFYSQVFGGPINIDVLGYEALLSASVPLEGLLLDLAVGTAEEALVAPTPVRGLLGALANQLAASGQSEAAAAAQAMYDAATTSATVIPADLVGMPQPVSGALVSAGDLITTAGQNADDDSLITLPLNLPPPLGDGQVLARIVQPLTPALLAPISSGSSDDDNVARSTQLLVEAPDLSINLPLLSSPLQLAFFVQAGHAEARVTDITCARRGREFDSVTVGARSYIGRIGLGRFDNIAGADPQPQPLDIVQPGNLGVSLPLLGTVQVPVSVRIRINNAYAPLGRDEDVLLPPYDGPFPEAGLTQRVGTPSTTEMAAALAEVATNFDIEVDITVLNNLGISTAVLNPLLASARVLIANALSSQLAGLLSALDESLLPTLEAAGATLGGADVTVYSVQTREPYLFTR